jgi:hypothetical protein
VVAASEVGGGCEFLFIFYLFFFKTKRVKKTGDYIRCFANEKC